MNTETSAPTQTITAERVPEGHQKLEVLPRHFGRDMLTVEWAVYGFMRALVSEYRGALWHFYELSNGGFYMTPDLDVKRFRIRVNSNGYEGQMSPEAAGITACLFAFSHLSFRIRNEALSRHYHALRDFALQHPEVQEILAAID